MRIIFTILLVTFSLHSIGQAKAEKGEAYKIAMEAIKVMDDGNYEKSIKMLNRSRKLDPEMADYPYEIGYAYFLQKDYEKAIKILEKVIEYKTNRDICFTLLGNIYDIKGQPKQAINTYRKGLVKFPKSGRLHYELGLVQQVLKKYDNAIESWESGIAVSPAYPSNYYPVSYYYCKSNTEKIWGMIYGELFMNIERGSKKTSEISKMLYDTYKTSIIVKSKNRVSVDFSKLSQTTIPENDKQMQIPFSMDYQLTIARSISPELKKEEVGIASFNNIRTSFIVNWFKQELNIKYPNILFAWHKKLIDLGYFESYNYWLLMKGNSDEFIKWSQVNKDKFDKFTEWFRNNRLPINKENKFQRLQYK